MLYVILSEADLDRDKIYTGPRGGRYFLRKNENGEWVKEYLDDEERAKETSPDNNENSSNDTPILDQDKPELLNNSNESNATPPQRKSGDVNSFDDVWNSMSNNDKKTLLNSLDDKRVNDVADKIINMSDEEQTQLFDKTFENLLNNNGNKCRGKLRKDTRSALEKAIEKYLKNPKRRFFKNHKFALKTIGKAAEFACLVGAFAFGYGLWPEDFDVGEFVDNQAEGLDDEDEYGEDNGTGSTYKGPDDDSEYDDDLDDIDDSSSISDKETNSDSQESQDEQTPNSQENQDVELNNRH